MKVNTAVVQTSIIFPSISSSLNLDEAERQTTIQHKREIGGKELVIQGSHMVSGTRCPARSDQLKKYSESRAAAPKGRCPVGHRGEFPDVLIRHIKGLTCLILSLTRLI